jgi:BirA family biotin operon repressor/biotin-[acetyl-CoA-carboxylase] ligase
MLPASLPAPADVLAALHAANAQRLPLRLQLRWYDSVTSTMDVAEEAAREGAAEGLVIAAGEQTRGRGRRGRVWSSPPGAGLYLTLLFRPPLGGPFSSALPLMTLAAGVAVRDAILRATGLAADLKWPNDLIVDRRKLAGILCEGLAIGTPEQALLVGVGINVRAAAHPGPVAVRATSLEAELTRTVERAVLLEPLLVALPRAYDALRQGMAGDILRSWRAASPSAEHRGVEWHDANGMHRGTTAGIDDTGALLVRTDHGIERVVAGELTWM